MDLRQLMLTHTDWIVIGVFLLLFAVFQFLGKLPKIASINEFLRALNSHGGNIFILSIFSFYFFVQSMRMLYTLINMVQSKTLTPDNAFALMGIQFATSTAFGGGFGALLKTMTGENPNRPTPEPTVNKTTAITP